MLDMKVTGEAHLIPQSVSQSVGVGRSVSRSVGQSVGQSPHCIQHVGHEGDGIGAPNPPFWTQSAQIWTRRSAESTPLDTKHRAA